jgi:glycosyltransferase involved in cell wall biosynthesis
MTAIIASHKLANLFKGVQVVAVSQYTAATLRSVFNTKCDAVILNPLKPLYLEPDCEPIRTRHYVTYIGRLIAAKNIHRLLPAIRDLLDENPGLQACIIGDGNMRERLESMVAGDTRFEFRRTSDDACVRECLRHTKVFVSGNEVEGFGITYLEAMSQGCAVAMPASGGGLEIALGRVGRSVQLLPLSWDRNDILATLRRAMSEPCEPIATTQFTARFVADSYLQVDAGFSSDGRVRQRSPAINDPIAPAAEFQGSRSGIDG